MILLTSYLNAGVYGGVEWTSASFDGTYKETYRGVEQKWNTQSDVNAFGLNLGYGYADSPSGEVYLNIGSDSSKIGLNFRHGFDTFNNNFFPQIVIGHGFIGGSKARLSNNSNVARGYEVNYRSPFVQLGVGFSYALNNTVELYGDVLVILGFDETYTSSMDIKEMDTYYTLDSEEQWDNLTIGVSLGVKFHAFGVTTLRRKITVEELRQETLEFDRKREKEIDSFID